MMQQSVCIGCPDSSSVRCNIQVAARMHGDVMWRVVGGGGFMVRQRYDGQGAQVNLIGAVLESRESP